MLNPAEWWHERVLERARRTIEPGLWERVWERLPLLWGFSPEDESRLRDLALLFLRRKSLEPVSGIVLDHEMRLTIALQACLPILHLGLDWYDGWVAVIVYPDEFVPEREWIDESGVVWVAHVPHTGEAWQRGPVILSWSDVEGGDYLDGVNVVLHEFAHKLDFRNGDANGHPPLHGDMSSARWAEVFGQAFADFRARVKKGEELDIDPYAAESPAEFFAVLTESFFELPDVLSEEYPAVYEQLIAFYRQDPLSRLRSAGVIP